jgi:DNA-binding transcriptional LysR family regulator
MDTRVSLHRLEVFCLIVETGGVTRAAERLMVAQPAVSAQLRSLETALGATLFVRNGNALILTEAGDRVYRWARETLASSHQVQRDVDELSSGLAGTVVVAASMGIGTYLLPPIMAALRRERPGADITVHIEEPVTALRSVQIGDADFAVVTWLADQAPDGVEGELLWDEPLLLYASVSGPPDTDVIDLADIAGLPYVGVPTGVAFDSVIRHQLRTRGLDHWTPVMRLGNAESIKQAIVDNGWVSLLSNYAAATDVAAGRLRAVRIRDAHLIEGIGFYQRPPTYLSALTRAAIAAVRAAAPQSAKSPNHHASARAHLATLGDAVKLLSHARRYVGVLIRDLLTHAVVST